MVSRQNFFDGRLPWLMVVETSVKRWPLSSCADALSAAFFFGCYTGVVLKFVAAPPDAPSFTTRVAGISIRDFRTDCLALADVFTCYLVAESMEVCFYRLADVFPLPLAIICISRA